MPAKRQGHTILIGYGELGKLVGEELQALHLPCVIIEDHPDRIHETLNPDATFIHGRANAMKLEQAKIDEARNLILTVTDVIVAGQLISYARSRNPKLISVAGANTEEEENYLLEHGASHVIQGKRAIAQNLVRLALGD